MGRLTTLEGVGHLFTTSGTGTTVGPINSTQTSVKPHSLKLYNMKSSQHCFFQVLLNFIEPVFIDDTEILLSKIRIHNS